MENRADQDDKDEDVPDGRPEPSVVVASPSPSWESVFEEMLTRETNKSVKTAKNQVSQTRLTS